MFCPAETVASKLRFTTLVDRCSRQFTTLCAGRRSTTDISVAVTDHDAQPFTAYLNDVRGGSSRFAGVVADAPAAFPAFMDESHGLLRRHFHLPSLLYRR